MGKADQQNLQRRPQGGGHEAQGGGGGPSRFCCERCTMGLRRVAGELSLRCVVVLVLGVAVFLSGIFWVLPLRTARSGFDAKDAVKLSATVQVSFRLKKPVSEIVKCIGRLEYDIYSEIGVPDTKVAVLSAHQSSSTNYTDVVFGVLSDQMNVPINQVSLSVLRSYLIDLFLGQFNLTVTASLFGQPSELQILKFPGGITVNPMQSVSIWQTPQILFNFTLYQSIYDIQENFLEFKEQLKYGLHLRSYENVYVQVTNTDGSTVADFVTVEASVTSDFGSLLPQRLKQLAQIISGSPKNLGLDNSVFGNVKGVSLSSYLKDTLHSGPPTPSPAPSPSFVPSASPHSWPYSYSPSPSPNLHPVPPCPKCEISVYFGYLFISNPRKMGPMSGHTADCTCGGIAPAASPFHSSPAQTPTALPPAPAAHSPYISPTSQHSPSFSPSPVVSIASPPVEDKGLGEGPVSPSLAPLQSSFAVPLSHIDMRLLVLSTFLINLLGWLSL